MKKFYFLSILCIAFGAQIFAQNSSNSEKIKFEFKYKQGDSYRILSTVNEDVYFNRKFHHNAECLNRISVIVTELDENGNGVHDATFMTSERASITENGERNTKYGGVFNYREDYKSIFTRDASGKYQISDEYFMPVVRDVPLFLDKEIAPGEKWTAEGHEAHDLRPTFGIEKPYKIPFNAEYQYLGIEKGEDGRIFHKFDIKYKMSYSIDRSKIYEMNAIDVPIKTEGYSHQTIYWDAERGYLDHYHEDFRIIMHTLLNNEYIWEGTAHAEVTEFERTADEETLADVMEKIEDLGIDDVTVTATEKGLTLSIENIQFLPDSDILRDSEKIKLNKIAEILNAYPNNDLLITGHTARRGTRKAQQQLSEERAQAVANYLVKINVRDKYHVFTQGMGGDVPVGDNDTEEGRAKNRRVEITIMDK